MGDEEYNESHSLRDMERVGELMENYLAKIASDRNLSITSFINLAEVIPEQERITEDGMYSAIDIYFKAHPDLSDMERKKVCGVIDCQKLSREACAHAAQNDRLPVQTVVQVLYYEQQCLHNAMDGSQLVATKPPALVSSKMNHQFSADPEDSSLKRENQELKFELLKMKMRLMEIEKPNSNRSVTSSPLVITHPSAGKPPLPSNSNFMSSVSKKLRILVELMDSRKAKLEINQSKDRRHSIS